MNEEQLRILLEELIEAVDDDEFPELGGIRYRSFAQAELLGGGEGLVIELPDGTEFQVSIVRSR